MVQGRIRIISSSYSITFGILILFSCCRIESKTLFSVNEHEAFHSQFVEVDEKASLACGTQSNNIYSFTVSASSPLGTINLLYAQHNGVRKMPYATTALYNSLNHQQLVARTDDFKIHPCSALQDKQMTCSNTFKMTDAQKALTGRTAFDRGHLTPINPMRFSGSAANSTFYCINIAPQDPYTNQGPWFTIEDLTHQKLRTTPGYVMTGVCDQDSSDGVTVDGWRVPACFWKLICYKDNGGVTRVVGFIGENKLFHKDDATAKAERTHETTKPRSQSEILARMTSSSFIQDAWRKAETYLLDNRNENNAPSPTNCINAITAPTGTLIEWGLQ